MDHEEAQEHEDYLRRELTLEEVISSLTRLRKSLGGNRKLHIQSHGCCPHNHLAWIVDYDDKLEEVVIRG
jgi:hypothetical protein